MNRSIIAASLLTLAIGAGGGYYLGQRADVPTHTEQAPQARKILYYRNPMGLADTSAVPKKDPMGMDYLPVYVDEAGAPAKAAKRKIIYYRNPMGLPDTSPVPKQDSMGMDYIPVYADEQPAAGQVQIAPEKIQKLGVRTEKVTKQILTHTVRAAGTVQIDERRQHVVTAKFEGWIDKLYVNTTGQAVKRGDALMEAYSPELLAAQREYLIALQGQKSLQGGEAAAQTGVRQLSDAALQRLRNWDIPEAQLKRLQAGGNVTRTIPFVSPADGVVLEKTAVAGMRFGPGEMLFKIADLANVWVIAEVYEQDLAMLRIGQTVSVSVTSLPGKSFSGKIGFIYPTLNPETRTARIRVELPNTGNLLKPAMYANVEVVGGDTKGPVVMIPNSSILDSGTRQLVLIQRAEGLFEPREVKLGMRTDRYTEVLSGVEPEETVVVGANFLIDAESNLKAALGAFGHSAHGGTAKQPSAPDAGQAQTTPAAAADHAGHNPAPAKSAHEGH
jgi:Cu(I)/Ag(I) efflux system membrane fusion protein